MLGARNGRRILGTAKVGQKGQIVIPGQARREYGIEPGDTLLLIADGARGILIAPPSVSDGLADRILNKEAEEK